MKVAVGIVFYYSLFAVCAYSQAPGSKPSPMEAFAKRHSVRTAWSAEVARWENDHTTMMITALVMQVDGPSPESVRGVRIDLSNGVHKDRIYLDEQATERTRAALKEIADAVPPSGFPGGCMGAKEFWPLYNWPWNKYHELNVDFCDDSKNLTLVLYGRGKSRDFQFPEKKPTDLAGILASATEQFKRH